jgi:hypothetical protein
MAPLLFLCGLLIVIFFQSTKAMSWFIDNRATGLGDGRSWDNAWLGFSKIVWNSIIPGDTLLISGGSSSNIYNEQLAVSKSGSAGSPIIIMPGQENGHNGLVIIESSDPYCTVQLWAVHYITINGLVNGERHIIVQNSVHEGVYIADSSGNIILTGLEVNNNGSVDNDNGIHISVDNYSSPIVEISYCSIHDNWQDQIHCNGPITPTTNYDQIIIHHNDISNLSDDGIECVAGGLTFYENNIHDIATVTRGTGHPDGLQIYQGHLRIFNNTIYNLQNVNSCIYIELYTTQIPRPDGDIFIYNNLLYEKTISHEPNNYYRGIQCVQGSGGGITQMSNIVIANNTIVNIPAWGIILDPNLPSDKVDSIIVVNNIVYNCFTIGGGQVVSIGDVGRTFTVGSSGTTANIIFDNNIISAGPNGTSDISFMGSINTYSDWVLSSKCNSHGRQTNPYLNALYSPNPDSSFAIGNGMDLSMFFSFDKNNRPRPTGAWDIGAFQSDTLSNRPPTAPLLLSPPNGSTGLDSVVSFSWQRSTDPNGDSVIYRLMISKQSDFSVYNSYNVALSKINSNFSISSILLGSIFSIILMPFPFARRIRFRARNKLLFTLLLAILGGFAFCNKSAHPQTLQIQPHDNNCVYSVSSLDPSTTYYWKVLAIDIHGASNESTIWHFSTKYW